MKQVHIFVSGFVQGVGYRAFVKKTAEKLKISGLVRNLGDRRVEIIAQGEEDKLKELAKKCEEGELNVGEIISGSFGAGSADCASGSSDYSDWFTTSVRLCRACGGTSGYPAVCLPGGPSVTGNE
jgi:acylphosphatase